MAEQSAINDNALNESEYSHRLELLNNQRVEMAGIQDEIRQDREKLFSLFKKYITKFSTQAKTDIINLLSELDENIEYTKIFIRDINNEIGAISDEDEGNEFNMTTDEDEGNGFNIDISEEGNEFNGFFEY